MKTNLLFGVVLATGVALLLLVRSPAQERPVQQSHEYTTIRWDGKENTHLIRPGGRVEFIGSTLRQLKRPDRCDERSFFMNAAMNGLAREGWDLVVMTADDIVMRRTVAR